MPSSMNRAQWAAHYAADPSTTADAPRLGALIALQVATALEDFLRPQPQVELFSVGHEYGQWEVFARPEPEGFDTHPNLRRLEAEGEHWGFAPGTVEALFHAMNAGRIPFLMANPAVAAEVASHIAPSIDVKQWQSRQVLQSYSLPVALPALALPSHPVWPLVRLQALHDDLCDRFGWGQACLRRQALAEVTTEIPRAPKPEPQEPETPPTRPTRRARSR